MTTLTDSHVHLECAHRLVGLRSGKTMIVAGAADVDTSTIGALYRDEQD